MEHEQVEKMLTGDCLCTVLPRFGMEVSVGDHGIRASENILFPDNASIQIPAKINDSLVATTDVFAVNNPFLWTTLWHLQVLLVSGLQKLRPEDLGEGFVAEEIVGRLDPPEQGFQADTCGRNDHVNMRMEVKVSCVGMKDGGESRSSSELFVVAGEGFQDILGHPKHQGIDGSLVPPGKLPELARKGEGNQVVCTWQQFTKLFVNPLLALMVLAMGTISVAA
jgi:hypothetical protein